MSDFFGQEIQVLQISVPVGTMVSWPGDNAPNDWMLCQGQVLKRADYPTLFGVLGVKYGAGSGDGTEFNLPDTRDRVVVGVSSAKVAGQTGGAESHVLTTAQMPSHAHPAVGDHVHSAWTGNAGYHSHLHGEHVSGRVQGTLGTTAYMFDTNAYGINGWRDNIQAGGDHAHAVGVGGGGAHSHPAVGGGEAHPIMQPFVAISQIIKII